MSCDAVQNRLLSQSDPRRLSEETRRHLSDCSSCQLMSARLVQLDDQLRNLPVPPSDPDVREAFIDRVTADGPVITRIPTIPRRDSVVDLPELLLKNGRWGYTAGIAAAIMLAVGAWWMTAGVTEPEPQVAALRHDLLGKNIKHLVAVTRSPAPADRIKEWAGVAQDLTSEARQLYLVAPTEEMTALKSMYERAVNEGVLGQADRLPDLMLPAEKSQLLTGVADQLSQTAAEANRLAATAPPPSRAALTDMATIARKAETRLRDRIRNGGA